MNVMELVKGIKDRGLAPEKIEVSEWQSWTLVSCYDRTSSNFISESVAMGIDKDPNIALAKGLTEYLERMLSKMSSDHAAHIVERSDGFAAFPVYDSLERARKRASSNALAEAIERFAWAKWWDDDEIFFQKSILNMPESIHLAREFQLKSIFSIKVPTSQDISLTILLAENSGGGFITGGAAGIANEEKGTLSRAFGELLRHLIVVSRMSQAERTDLSFYEKRLWGFASGDWRELVVRRLSATSKRKVDLPKLIADQPISHQHSDLICIHRCLFENQPIFIGGPLERLCI